MVIMDGLDGIIIQEALGERMFGRFYARLLLADEPGAGIGSCTRRSLSAVPGAVLRDGAETEVVTASSSIGFSASISADCGAGFIRAAKISRHDTSCALNPPTA